MSMLQAMLNRNIYHFEQAYPGTRECTTEEMQRAIADWFALYFQDQVTEKEDPCQRLPYTIVHKLTRACFSEYQVSASENKPFVQELLQRVESIRKKTMQLALIGGEAWIKPIPKPEGFEFIAMRRDMVTVLGRDFAGNVTDLGSAEVCFAQGAYYTLLERRHTEQGQLVIENKLFRSLDVQSIGIQVPLSTLEAYKNLPEQTILPYVDGLGLVSVRVPMENCVDGSSDAVSVYAAATGLIHNINQNERQLTREFENGESRVFASADLLSRKRNGEQVLPAGLFVGLDDDPETTGLTIFSPELRQESFLARKREYLRNVETLIGLKRGILGEVEAAQRTATEVTSSQGDYSLTIQDLQQMWEQAIRQLVQLCGRLGCICKMPQAEQALEADAFCMRWGDGVLFDKDKEWEEVMELVKQGMLKTEIALAWKYGLPWQREEDLEEIRRKYMPQQQKED